MDIEELKVKHRLWRVLHGYDLIIPDELCEDICKYYKKCHYKERYFETYSDSKYGCIKWLDDE